MIEKTKTSDRTGFRSQSDFRRGQRASGPAPPDPPVPQVVQGHGFLCSGLHHSGTAKDIDSKLFCTRQLIEKKKKSGI